MTRSSTTWLALLLMGLASCVGWAQESETKKPDPAGEQEQDVVAEINKLVRGGDLDEAVTSLDEALENAEGEQVDKLQNLRNMIGSGYMRKREYGPAAKQYGMLFDHLATKAEEPSAQSQLANAANMYGMLGSREGMAQEAFEKIMSAVEKMQAMESEGEVTGTSANMARMIQTLANLSRTYTDRKQEVGTLLENNIDRVGDYLKKNELDEKAISAYSALLQTASSFYNDNPEVAAKYSSRRMEFLTGLIKENPENATVGQEYLNAVTSQVAMNYRDQPDEAMEMIETASKNLSELAEDNLISRSMERLKSYEGRIESAKKVLEMIGQPAPELDIDAWVNNDEANASLESLKGKVVVLDFWAIWCGPCIATFPHLRELREEFHDEGFEIVGITRYYNYKWDEEKGEAVRGEESTPEQEYEAIAKFLQSKDMKHPSIVQPKDSDVSARYGVTGIPHAVVLDRQGRVQLIKVGSGEANAKAIHDKVKELIAEK